MRLKQQWQKGSLLAVLAATVMGLAIACGGGSSAKTATTTATSNAGAATPAATGIPTNLGKDDKAQVTGAGSTFAAPIYQAWFDEYNKKVAPGVQLNYQSIGSGGGIQQFTDKTVDFGATDAPLSDAEFAKAPDAVHIPTVLGSVVLSYNIAGVTSPLKLDASTLAGIYLGTIKKWSDPAMAALNPGVKLPDADIQVAYRSDGSGTSFVFTDYLSTVSPDWKTKVGTSKNPNWPVGQGGKGNEGVTNIVKQTANSIGYVELQYALTNKLSFADMKNQAGKFVTPTIASTSAAAAGATIPADYRVSIVNAAGDASYPIATFTWILVHKDAPSCSNEAPLVRSLWWAMNDKAAGDIATGLVYAPVPPTLLTKIDTTLKSLTCAGKAILPAS